MATIRDEIDSMSMWPKVPQRKTGLTKKSAIEKWGFPALIAAATIADLTGDNRKFRNEAIPKALTLLGTNLIGQEMGKRRQTDTMAETDFQNQWLQYQDVINRMEFGAQERAEQAKQQRLNRGDELDMKKWMLENWQPPNESDILDLQKRRIEIEKAKIDLEKAKKELKDNGGKFETPYNQYGGGVENPEITKARFDNARKFMKGKIGVIKTPQQHAAEFKKVGLTADRIDWDKFQKEHPKADTAAIKQLLK